MFSRIALGANRMRTSPLLTRVQSMSVKTSFLQCEEFGPPEKVLHQRTAELKAPADNEILVKILVSPINPADINVIQGEVIQLAYSICNLKLIEFNFVFFRRKIRHHTKIALHPRQ